MIHTPEHIRRSTFVVLTVCLALLAASAVAQTPSPVVNFSPVAADGHAATGTNAVAIARNNLVTAGDHQFIGFYDKAETGDAATVKLGRRQLGANDWTVIDTGIAPIGGVSDDHNIIALAIDGDGFMHLSHGMHDHAMQYRVSNVPVTSATFNITGSSFSKPAYWAGTAATNDSSVTYPEFYNIPGSKDLLFVYRQGASGSGDQYSVRYSAQTKSFDNKVRITNGTATSVNAYANRLVFDSQNRLHMSWTWRETPDYQTNHDILYARSPDNGITWTRQNGTPYGLPIGEVDSRIAPASQAQIIAPIPEGSSLINQADMTVDSNDNPLIATWYMPPGASSRQYMLHYHDGATWQASQITNRNPAGSDIRLLGRPLVLSDEQDRTLVVLRYDQGSNNGITVAYSDDKQTWEFLTLSSLNMGFYEPTYDPVLWERENKLHLFFQPFGTGAQASQVSVLEWDAKAYFTNLPEPTALGVAAGSLLLMRRRYR